MELREVARLGKSVLEYSFSPQGGISLKGPWNIPEVSMKYPCSPLEIAGHFPGRGRSACESSGGSERDDKRKEPEWQGHIAGPVVRCF